MFTNLTNSQAKKLIVVESQRKDSTYINMVRFLHHSKLQRQLTYADPCFFMALISLSISHFSDHASTHSHYQVKDPNGENQKYFIKDFSLKLTQVATHFFKKSYVLSIPITN